MHAGTTWLSLAIQNAMIVGAHRFHQERDKADKQAMAKKRLWWSIIIRDRIMPLALRRSPQIENSHFDLDLEGLNEDDLQDEIACSRVYNPSTKVLLAKLLFYQCQFALVLTELLATAYNPKMFTMSRSLSQDQFLRELGKMAALDAKLVDWFGSIKGTLDHNLQQGDEINDSLKLHSELMYMYYQ